MLNLGYVSIAFLALAALACGQKFPASIKQCLYSDDTCLITTVEDILTTHSKGVRELNIIPLDPLEIKSLSFKKIPGATVSVDLNLKNASISGLSTARVIKVTGFKKTLQDMDIDLEVRVPEVTISGMYDIDGEVNVLPISGKGECTGIFDNVLIVAQAKCRKSGTNLNVNRVIMDFQPNRVTYNFGNLFNGDKVLGDNMNAFLNENWELFFSQLKPLVDESLAKILLQILKGPFSKIPYTELFLAK